MKYLQFKATKGYRDHFDPFCYVGEGDVLEVNDKKANESDNVIADKVVTKEHAENLLKDYPKNFFATDRNPSIKEEKVTKVKPGDAHDDLGDKVLEEGETKQITEDKKTSGKKK